MYRIRVGGIKFDLVESCEITGKYPHMDEDNGKLLTALSLHSISSTFGHKQLQTLSNKLKLNAEINITGFPIQKQCQQ